MGVACFTGHRKIFNSYYNHLNPTAEWSRLRNHLAALLYAFAVRPEDPVDRFISGMAIGVDQLAAECVRTVMQTQANVRLIAAIPFPSQPNNWPAQTQAFYHELLASAINRFTLSDDPYAPHKMHVRDRWMVDSSDFVIAIWDGRKSGGTFYTISYALDTNTPVYWINPLVYPYNGVWLTSKEGLL